MIRRVLCWMAIPAFGLILSGCAGLNRDWTGASAATAPVPLKELDAHTAAVYIRQESGWHQLRLKLDARGRSQDKEDDSYSFYFRSTVSAWRFNSKTGDYDIMISRTSLNADRGLRFGFYQSRGDSVMLMTAGNGGEGGGSNGLPDSGFSNITMRIDPRPDSSGVAITDELILNVTTILTIEPNDRERKKGIGERKAEVTRSWKVKKLPGRKGTFTEVTR